MKLPELKRIWREETRQQTSQNNIMHHPPASSTGEQQTELREKRERKLFRLQYNDDIHFMLNELKNYVASSVTAIIDITKLEGDDQGRKDELSDFDFDNAME